MQLILESVTRPGTNSRMHGIVVTFRSASGHVPPVVITQAGYNAAVENRGRSVEFTTDSGGTPALKLADGTLIEYE